MEGRTAPRTTHAVLGVLAAGPLLAVLVAAMALPPADLGTSGVAWLPATLALVLVAAATGAALAQLVVGLRQGSVAWILAAASAAAVAGGAVATLAGARQDVPLFAASVALLGAAVAGRTRMALRRHGARVALAVVAVALAEAAVLVELLPATAAVLDDLRPAPAAAALGLVLVAALAGIGLPVAGIAAALTVGVAAAAAGRDGLEVVIGMAALVAAQLVALASVGADGDEPVTSDRSAAAPLPPLAARLDDAILRFDGSLRLVDWNAAAAGMLGLDTAARGSRLEDLLGVAVGDLPAVEGSSATARGGDGLAVALHRHDGGVTTVIRDPAATTPETDRLARELRGTIEELLEARRTIDLQRRELDRATLVDPLTGVANRAATIDRLATEVAQARRYRHPVAVALLDVDGFSLVNRKHGMAAGDAALREVALRIRLRIRAADELGRINGDRFLAILPHTDDAGATSFAEALRRRLAHRPVGAGETAMRLTASVGIAVMQPGEPLDVDGLLARAHDALAAAKGAGGDRIARAATPELERLDDRREPRLHAIDRDEEQDAGEP